MTISIATFDDLHASQKPNPVDHNPRIACDQCGESWAYQDYWRGRWDLHSHPRLAPVVCDDCLERMDELHSRLTNNHSLAEYADDPREGDDDE